MLTKIPDQVLGYLEKNKKLRTSVFLLAVGVTELIGGEQTYVFATQSELVVLCGSTTLEVLKKHRFSAPKAELSFAEHSFETYPLDSIVKSDSEETAGGIRYLVRDAHGDHLICYTTNTYKETITLFFDYLDQIRRGAFDGIDPLDAESYCPKCGRRFPDPRGICPNCSGARGNLTRLIPFFKRYIPQVAIILLLMVFISALGVLSPYVSNSFFFDKVLTEGGSFYGRVVLVLIIIGAIKLADLIASVINDITTSKIATELKYDLKKTLFESINRLSLSFFTSSRTGGLMLQLENDSETIYRYFGEIIPWLIIDIVKIIVMCVIMIMMDPLLSLVAVSFVPVYVVIMKYIFSWHRRKDLEHYIKRRAVTAKVSDILSGIRVVKAFAKESEESRRFGKLSFAQSDIFYRTTMFDNIMFPCAAILLNIGLFGVWALGGIRVFRGELSYGDFLTFIAYIGMVYEPLDRIIRSISGLGECSSAASRLFEILDAHPDVSEKPNPIHIKGELRGDIEFSNVDFSYTKSKRTLDSVSFKVPAGSTLGIVGHTGSGKSTIVNLLVRLYDVSGGSIKLDGIDVRELAFEDIRRNIAVVSQETYVFSGTVFENIAYAVEGATYADVIKASCESGAHDFIMKLPDGYETKIGFGSRALSGGELQRISIARALLRRPRILILDEATAAMDTVTEQRISRAISKLSGDLTTIMIAHRLSTLKDADKLLVIEDGRVAEYGTHSELMEKENGIYRKLCTLQLEAMKNILSDGSDAQDGAQGSEKGSGR